MMEAAPQRIPPQDLGAERAVLGALLIEYSYAWPLVEATGLKAADFYKTFHAELFGKLALWAWAGRQPDPLTIRDSFCRSDRHDPQEVGDFLIQLMDVTPTAANADFYARIVKEKALRRQLIRSSTVTIQKAYEDDEDGVAQEIQFALDDLERLQAAGVGREELLAIDGNQLLADPPAPRDLVIGHGILALGEWLLVIGEPKAGKSAMALDLAGELVRDQEAEDTTWAGFNVHAGRRVLYLVGEGGRRAMFRRWHKRAQGLGKHERARFYTWFPHPHLMDVTDAAEYARLERFVKDNGIDVVIVDPLAHFHNGDENDAGDMKRAAGQFIRLNAATGCAVVVVHHTRKPQGGSRPGSALEGRGSTAIFGASDGAIVLAYEGGQDDSERRMTFSLRHAEEYVDPQIVTLNRKLLRFEVVVRDPGGRRQKDALTAQDFLEWLTAYGKAVLIKDAAAETGIPLRTIERYRAELMEAGLLARWRESGRKPYQYGLPAWFEKRPKQAALPGAEFGFSQTDEGGLAKPKPDDT